MIEDCKVQVIQSAEDKLELLDNLDYIKHRLIHDYPKDYPSLYCTNYYMFKFNIHEIIRAKRLVVSYGQHIKGTKYHLIHKIEVGNKPTVWNNI